MNKTLLQSYQNAIYVVDVNGEKHEFRVGNLHTSLDKLLSSEKVSQAIFITAFNPASIHYPIDINLKNNKRLREDLVKLGYSFFHGYGGDEENMWPKEGSLLVLNVDLDTADKLAIKYQQNAYLWIEIDCPVKLRSID